MKNTTINNSFLTLKDAAEILNVSPATIRRLIFQNHIPAYQFGNQYRIESGALEKYIKTSSLSPSEDLSTLD